MKHSENIAKLNEALAKAQSKFEKITTNKIGQEGNIKFPYSTLANSLSSVLPHLNEVGIFVSQPVITLENGDQRVTTRLELNDEWKQSDGIKLSSLAAGKQLGKEITYARRIDLMAFLSVSATEDDEDAPDLKPSTVYVGKNFGKPVQTVAEVKKIVPATSFPHGHNVSDSITDNDLPENFSDTAITTENKLSPEASQIAQEMENFVPLTESRNEEIQNRLKELVANKIIDRRKLQTFIDDRHEGKRGIDVQADKWEETIRDVEAAVAGGPDTIKKLFSKKAA